jgi:hypothetical protein
MPFVLFLLLVLAVGQAQADPIPVPDTDDLKGYAVGVTENGQSLAAFNFVQDTLHRPHIAEIRYDSETDRFYWKGPRTGKPMSMDRARCTTEIFYPYYRWCDRHNSD